LPSPGANFTNAFTFGSNGNGSTGQRANRSTG
jgi:hypothetical protein